MNQVAECNVLESALSQLESTAVNFAYRFINDGPPAKRILRLYGIFIAASYQGL